MAGSTALKNPGGFGGKSPWIILLVFVSSDTSLVRFRTLELSLGAINDGESVVQLGRFLRISRHVGMPGAFPGLEWYLESEFLKEQF